VKDEGEEWDQGGSDAAGQGAGRQGQHLGAGTGKGQSGGR
jgi:hypothetical protein